MRKFLILLAFLGGCSNVRPADQQVISANADNARAMNTAIQKNTYIEVAPDGTQKPAEYIKVWWAAEAKTWTSLEAWSKGVAPTTQP